MFYRRFSEDIDFDFYSNESLSIIKEKLYKKIKEILKEYDVKKPRMMNQTMRFDIYYTGIQKDKIILEFRIISKKTPKTTSKIVDFSFIPFTASIYPIYSLEELINQKLLAFVNRTDGKDAYDLYYLLQLDYKSQDIKKDLIIRSKEKINYLLLDKKQIKYLENSINYYIPRSKRLSLDSLLNELLNFLK